MDFSPASAVVTYVVPGSYSATNNSSTNNTGSGDTGSGSSGNTGSGGGDTSTNNVNGGGDSGTNNVSGSGTTNSSGGYSNVVLTTAYTASTNGPYGMLGNNGGLNIGQTFAVSGTNVEIFSLGVYNYGGLGLNASHSVTIFVNSNGTYVAVPGGWITVPAGASTLLTNGYRYQPLAQPIVLGPGNYAVVAFQMNGGPSNDAYCEYLNTGFQGITGLNNTGSTYQFTTDPGPSFPTSGGSATSAGVTYGCASFLYGFGDTNNLGQNTNNVGTNNSGGGSNTNNVGGSGDSGTNNVSGSGTNNASGSGTNNASGSGTNNVSGSGTNNVSGSGTNYDLITAYTGSTNGPYGSLGYNAGLNIGQTFAISGTNLEVFSLGVYNYGGAGLNASHTVSIFLDTGSAYELVTGGSVTVPAGAGTLLTNGYRYQALPSPIVLGPGNYAIIAFQMDGGPDNDGYSESEYTGFNGVTGFVNTGSVYQFTTDPGPNYPARSGGASSSAGVTYGCASFIYGIGATNAPAGTGTSDTNNVGGSDNNNGSTNNGTGGGDSSTNNTGGSGNGNTNTVSGGGDSGSGTNNVGGSGTNNVGGSGTNNVGGSGTNNVGGSGTNNVGGSGTNNVGGSGTNNVSGSGTTNSSNSMADQVTAYTANTNGPYGALGWNGGLNIGQTFVLVGTNLQVDSLGVYNYGGAGLNAAHTVSLLVNNGGTYQAVPGGTITVPAGTNGILTNGYRFAALPSPVTIGPGGYAIIVFQLNGGPGSDPYSDDTGINNGFSGIPGLYNTGSVYQFTTDPARFPSSYGGNPASAGVEYGCASFTYTVAGDTNAGAGNGPSANVSAVQIGGSHNLSAATNFVGATVLTNSNNGFSVLVSGNGRLNPALAAAAYVTGKKYSLTAVPAAGSVFDNWLSNGVVFSSLPHLTFTVASNLILQANFLTNPFVPVAGTYHGLFYVPSNAVEESSGSIVTTVTKAGAYSAKIYVGARAYSMAGSFSVDGTATKTINRPGSTPVTVQLQLGLTNGPMTGTVSDGNWEADLVANPAVYSKANPAPQAGKYTMVIPGNASSSAEPAGDGFGAVIVSPLGMVTFSGTLGDGTAVAASSIVSSNGQWPFYASLYNGNGSAFGLVLDHHERKFRQRRSWLVQTSATDGQALSCWIQP